MKSNTWNINHMLAFSVAVLLLLLYFLPLLLLGENSYFTIHDNLDGPYVYNRLLSLTGETYNFHTNSIIGNVMNGLPRSIYGNGLFIVPGLFYFFKPSTAYTINFILTHFIGFIGMFLLLRNHILKEQKHYLIVLACSVLFALVPFYSIYGASVPYQPLLFFSFLNLFNSDNKNLKDYLIIGFYPFYSYTILVGPFVFIFLVLIFLIKTFIHKKFYSKYFLGLCILLLAILIFDITLVYQSLFKSDFIPSRSEFKIIDLIGSSNYGSWWKKQFFSLLYETQYHTGHFYVFPIIIALLITSGVLFYFKNYNHPVIYLAAAVFFISFLYASYPWIVSEVGEKFILLKTFQFDRFYFLLPSIWIVLFAYCIKELNTFKDKFRILTWILLAGQFFIMLNCNVEIKENVKLLFHQETKEPSCKAFFSENLFDQIKNFIGGYQKDYRVVSVGIHPSVALYNGFYTLDGYQPLYDLRYKHKFRQIISKELDKDNDMKNYFDKWGGRCYIFSAELGRNYLAGKKSSESINNLSLDFPAMKKMGGKYILSAVQINNLDSTAVKFEKKFQDKDSYWDIYLYQLI